ncbi:MAG: hypothetical protein ACRECP_03465 [Methylocella sp.]
MPARGAFLLEAPDQAIVLVIWRRRQWLSDPCLAEGVARLLAVGRLDDSSLASQAPP